MDEDWRLSQSACEFFEAKVVARTWDDVQLVTTPPRRQHSFSLSPRDICGTALSCLFCEDNLWKNGIIVLEFDPARSFTGTIAHMDTQYNDIYRRQFSLVD